MFIYFGQALLVVNYALVLFLHELSHAVVAYKLGYKIDNFVLLPFGVSMSVNSGIILPEDEVKIAIAGPLCNLVLTILCMALWWIVPATYNATYLFCYANLITCLFNFLPAFPLDGGRIALGLLKKSYQDKTAEKTVKIFAVFIILLLVILFVYSLFVRVNVTFLLVIICVASGLFEGKGSHAKYNFINYQKLKAKKQVLPLKSYVVKDSVPLFKCIRLLSKNNFAEFVVVNSGGNVLARFGENKFLSALEFFPLLSPLSQVIYFLK